jgi:hypothetical protein
MSSFEGIRHMQNDKALDKTRAADMRKRAAFHCSGCRDTNASWQVMVFGGLRARHDQDKGVTADCAVVLAVIPAAAALGCLIRHNHPHVPNRLCVHPG